MIDKPEGKEVFWLLAIYLKFSGLKGADTRSRMPILLSVIVFEISEVHNDNRTVDSFIIFVHMIPNSLQIHSVFLFLHFLHH